MGSSMTIAIPTLTRYDLLLRLCKALLEQQCPHDWTLKIKVLDNGGLFTQSKFFHDLGKIQSGGNAVEILTPKFNLGVAGSWNFFASRFGQCIICNDDVIFSWPAIQALVSAARQFPDTIIFENTDKVAGFSTFLLNRPKAWLEMGGFDEVLNPAYFEDNDCRYRLSLAGNPVKSVELPGWAHDNSSTLSAATESYKRMHWCLFQRNQKYYHLKWGGGPGEEKYIHPFGLAG